MTRVPVRMFACVAPSRPVRGNQCRLFVDLSGSTFSRAKQVTGMAPFPVRRIGLATLFICIAAFQGGSVSGFFGFDFSKRHVSYFRWCLVFFLVILMFDAA